MMTSSTSLSRQRYLAQIRRRRRLITATRWGLLLALFALWEAGAQLGLINDFLLSSPSRMVRTAVSLIQSGELFLHIGTTKAYEILDLIGFKVVRSKRCTKTKLIEWIEGGGTP